MLSYTYLDNEVPEFRMCPVNQTLDTQPGLPFAVAVWQHPNASDNSVDKPVVTCNHMSGSNFTIGHTLVTCEAVDSSGNNKICSFIIFVKGTYVFEINIAKLSFVVCRFCFLVPSLAYNTGN